MTSCAETAERATRWEHYERDGKAGVRGFGETKPEAFEQAALALTALIADLRTIGPFEMASIHCEAPGDDPLLAEWLQALVRQMSTRKLFFRRFLVNIEGSRLRARAWGEPIDPERHRPAHGWQGATFAAPRVARVAEGWLAQCMVKR